MADWYCFVVCYDVTQDKRRRKLAKLLDGYGDRVQGSVFEAELTKPMMELMSFEASQVIKPDEDSLIIYRLIDQAHEPERRFGKATNNEFANRAFIHIV